MGGFNIGLCCLYCKDFGRMRTVAMIITTRDGKSFDTDTDLTAPERHILQKLIIWELFASSVDQFREKEKEAMSRGWNNSGPIKTSEAMRAILAELEDKVVLRLSRPLPFPSSPLPYIFSSVFLIF